jgi:DNA recombination protein RmuC
MPPEVEAALPWILGTLAAGFLFGVLLTCLVVSASRARLEEKFKAVERQAADLAARHAAATAEAAQNEKDAQTLRTQLVEVRTRLEDETQAAEQHQALLDRSEQRRAALEALLRPVAETIGKFDARLGEMEKARGSATAELQGQVQILAALAGQLGELGNSLGNLPGSGAPLPAITAVNEFGDDFGFLPDAGPDPKESAKSAASDLRSALGG